MCDFNVFPNPSIGNAKVSITDIAEATTVELIDNAGRVVKSIELKRNAGIWEYTPETFQFLCWPLGIWWTQPRLNKIATRDVVINE